MQHISIKHESSKIINFNPNKPLNIVLFWQVVFAYIWNCDLVKVINFG
jgi:hypothetical protein